MIFGPSDTTKWTGTSNNKTITADGPTGQWSAKKENITVVGVKKVVRVEGTTQTDGPLIVPVGTSVLLKALRDPGDAMVEQTGPFPADWPKWSFKKSTDVNDQQLESETGSRQIPFSRTEPGEYIVKAQCGTSSGTFTVTFVGVEKVIVDGATPEDEGPVKIAVGDTVQLRAISSPASVSFPGEQPVWTVSSETTTQGTGETFMFHPEIAGTYEVTATCGSGEHSDDRITIYAIGIDYLLVDGIEVTDEETALDICHKETATLKAVPDPGSVTFPSQKPVWTIETQPQGADLSNPLGTGDEVSIEFIYAGNYEIKATCGTSIKTVKLKVGAIQYIKSSAQVAFANGPDVIFTAMKLDPTSELACLEWEFQRGLGITATPWTSISGTENTVSLPASSTPGYYRFRARNGSHANWKQSEDVLLVKLDHVTATELNAGSSTSNKVVVDPGETGSLWLCVPSGASSRSVRFSVAPQQDIDGYHYILYMIDGSGASPASGDFSGGGATVSFQDGIYNIVYVGYDKNLDGTLQSNERMLTIKIQTVNFSSSAWVVDNRTSAPAEQPFPVVSDEHQEVDGTFNFELIGSTGANETNSLVRYQVWDQGGLDEIIQSGKGLSFSRTWTAGRDEGNTYVRFYGDSNDNTEYNSGIFVATEQHQDSPSFRVQKKKIYNLDVRYSSSLGTLTKSAVQAAFDASVDRALHRDSAVDFRACIELRTTSKFDEFVADVNNPDPADTEDKEQLILGNNEYNITILKDATNRGRVRAISVNPPRYYVNWAYKRVDTIVHELGHCRGLLHDGHTDMYIMCDGGAVRKPEANLLLQADANALDQ